MDTQKDRHKACDEKKNTINKQQFHPSPSIPYQGTAKSAVEMHNKQVSIPLA
jgi:hypothetical protein